MNTLSALVRHSAFALAYRVCEPAPAKPTALLVLLHGLGGNETNLAMLAATASAGTLVVLPRGPLELGPGQHAWFRVAFTANGPQIDAAQAEASRMALVDFAQRQGCWIVEDDYDSEFLYDGRPTPSLQGLDDGGRVIYIGTFSKTLFPSLRIAYAVLPEALVQPMVTARSGRLLRDTSPSSAATRITAAWCGWRGCSSTPTPR